MLFVKLKGKRNKTIYTEYRAGLNLFFFLQDCGANALTDIEARMIYGFFYNGNKVIRRGSYCHLVKRVLGSVVDKHGEHATRIICLLPKIREPRKLFDHLQPEESRKVYDYLKNELSSLSHMERAMGWILYFVGLRGTEILPTGLKSIGGFIENRQYETPRFQFEVIDHQSAIFQVQYLHAGTRPVDKYAHIPIRDVLPHLICNDSTEV